MENFAAGSIRTLVLRLFQYLLILSVYGVVQKHCFGFVSVSTIHVSRKTADRRPSFGKNSCAKVHMSLSLDDAAFLGKNAFQVIIDTAPIGLPIAGIAAAVVLSKSGIQQREDLRTEVEQVQTNIIKKSEEATRAGIASNTFLAISVLSTVLSIGNVITKIPMAKDNFISSNNQVVNQIVVVPSTISMNEKVVERDDMPVLSETLIAQNTRDELLTNAKEHASAKTQTTTNLQIEDSKTELSEVILDKVVSSTILDSAAISLHEILPEDETKDSTHSTENALSTVVDTIITQQTTALEKPIIAGSQKREESQADTDSLLVALNQYRLQGSMKTVSKEFIGELIDLMKAWAQSATATISNDPLIISITQHMKDSIKMIEISLQIVNDRLPSDSQPFVKGFLVGTLLLNVFNEGQKYKEDVYTMYSTENDDATTVTNEKDATTSEQQMMVNGTVVAKNQAWIEEIESDGTVTSLVDEKESVVDEVQALAEVLISKRIVKDLLQKKKEKQKPYFASSIIAISDQESVPFPQPPMETPPIELFDTYSEYLPMIVEKANLTNEYSTLSSNSVGQSTATWAVSKRWTVPFLRSYANNSRDEKYVPAKAMPAEGITNRFTSWLKTIAESLVDVSTEKAFDTTAAVSSPAKPSKVQPNLFTESSQQDAWLNWKNDNFESNFSADYDFITPSNADKLFNSDEISYEESAAQDDASGPPLYSGNFVEKQISSTSISPKPKMETESFEIFNMSQMQFNNEQQGSDQLENKEDKRINPFIIPVSDDSVKSGSQWPPSMKRTSYGSTSKRGVKKVEPKTVEFNSPFDSYEYQYTRYGGSSPGSFNASNASTGPPPKFGLPPNENEATFSALNIYASEPTQDIESEKTSWSSIASDQPFSGELNNYEYSEQLPNSNGIDEPKKYEFPEPPKFEPTFSALSIYGEPSTESPTESDASLDTKLQYPEYIEPTFSALSIYSVLPESIDVASTSNSENLYSSVEPQPMQESAKVIDPSTKDKENYVPVTFESNSSSEPSFHLADLFNESTTVQEADKHFESQEAVSIPITDVLPPSFQVDLEVPDSSHKKTYENVNMFSILPDMNDIFSAKPSYNPYLTRQPEKQETNDMRNDAIDTPIDTNPTYPDNSVSIFMLPQEVSTPTAVNAEESRKFDLPLANQSPEGRKSEDEEVNELTIDIIDNPVNANPTKSVNGTATELSPMMGLSPKFSVRTTSADPPSPQNISERLDKQEWEHNDSTTQTGQITDSPIKDRNFLGNFDAEFSSTSLNSEDLDQERPKLECTNDPVTTETAIEPNISLPDNSDSLSSSLQVDNSSKSNSIDSSHSDIPSAANTDTSLSEHDAETLLATNAMGRDTVSVSPQETEITDVSPTQGDSATKGDTEYIWDDEPFQ